MRLDKFLVECGIGSRKDVKKIISKKEITVNDSFEIKADKNIEENKDIVKYGDKILEYKKYRYYIMNKKAGYITATEDSKDKTVMDLLPDWVIKKDLAPVGRLDKDTEGLLLFTNDGQLNHKLLSPKNHIDKIYHVELEKDIDKEDIEQLEKGVDIGGYITQPAIVEKKEERIINLTIREGKFHQVKKMMEAIDNKVLYLKRIKFGKINLDNMELGEVSEINIEDIL